jgi:hypothetical protein
MMRTLLVTLAVFSVAGCRCGVDKPTPVTLKVKNPGGTPIFVDDTSGVLGLTVQRQIGAEWFSFNDKPCNCLTCETVCNARCACDQPVPRVRKLAAGTEAVRTWDGVVRVEGFASCGQGCLTPENAAPDEKLRVQLCYANQVQGYGDNPDGGSTALTFPASQRICNEKEFRPQDGLVEISPKRGADCTITADCKGSGELCFGGACTTSCPANEVPELGGTWQLYIPEPDNQGFFATSTTAGRTAYTGTGTLSSVLYQGATIVIRLQRKGAQNETLNGTVYLKLPPDASPALVVGTAVTVTVVDGSTMTNPENRALVIRDAQGGLMLAADAAQEGAILAPAQTTPFTVTFATVPFGCSLVPCGRQLYYPTRFAGPTSVSVLEPGQSGPHVTPQGTYKLLNVASYDYPTTQCNLKQVRSWVAWREVL